MDINLTMEEVEECSKNNNLEELQYKVIKEFGDVYSGKNNTISFRLIDWGYGKGEQYDLRWWKDNKPRKKGITFDYDEIKKMQQNSNYYDLNLHYRELLRTSYLHKAKFYQLIDILSDDGGWRKEINMIDWGKGVKIDIRKWNDTYDKCSKGITLSTGDAKKFFILIREI